MPTSEKKPSRRGSNASSVILRESKASGSQRQSQSVTGSINKRMTHNETRDIRARVESSPDKRGSIADEIDYIMSSGDPEAQRENY